MVSRENEGFFELWCIAANHSEQEEISWPISNTERRRCCSAFSISCLFVLLYFWIMADSYCVPETFDYFHFRVCLLFVISDTFWVLWHKPLRHAYKKTTTTTTTTIMTTTTMTTWLLLFCNTLSVVWYRSTPSFMMEILVVILMALTDQPMNDTALNSWLGLLRLFPFVYIYFTLMYAFLCLCVCVCDTLFFSFPCKKIRGSKRLECMHNTCITSTYKYKKLHCTL